MYILSPPEVSQCATRTGTTHILSPITVPQRLTDCVNRQMTSTYRRSFVRDFTLNYRTLSAWKENNGRTDGTERRQMPQVRVHDLALTIIDHKTPVVDKVTLLCCSCLPRQPSTRRQCWRIVLYFIPSIFFVYCNVKTRLSHRQQLAFEKCSRVWSQPLLRLDTILYV